VLAPLVVGLLVSASMVGPYVGEAWRAIAAWRALEPALRAAEAGQPEAALRLGEAAAARDLRSPRPWLILSNRLWAADRPNDALAGYRRAQSVAKPGTWLPRLAFPRVLAETGHPDEAESALTEANVLSWETDPWIALEVAWRDLPAPGTDEIRLGGGDYGAVRGFQHPRGLDSKLLRRFSAWNLHAGDPPSLLPPGTHRWTRHRAWLRLRPTHPAPAYNVTLWMGSPFPSPVAAPEVRVRASGGADQRFTLGREIRPYVVRAEPASGAPLLVEIDAPTWCREGEPAEQGVRVDRMTVEP
jgi:hypothetical protein